MIDFASHFRAPGKALLKIFATNWPHKDARGQVIHDTRTNSPRLTGFSAVSRRCNNMFSLAMHEIHSTTSEKELRFGNDLRPSNVRIHGTMYRRIWSCADTTPLRYLVVDPAERTRQAATQHVDAKLLRRLEHEILPHNSYMKELKCLSKPTARSKVASVELQWDEGLQEIAAIVHESSEVKVCARSVLFCHAHSAYPQYVNPLSALYEPLSYPLWYPFGGRGWSTDILSTTGVRVTQMWWYRQQLLRLPHMHLCGRLLNEWLVNMFCRMEDERLALIRRDQSQRIATRAELTGVLSDASAAAGATGRTYHLPSSVPGSPRHLRRLRVDALELARRRGPPTYFITLTCNPYWPEIVDSLHPGQTAADRPDLVVRVFHARLEKMMAFLKHDFCGDRRYVIRVIEYQRRGLPHAHIAIALASPPTTPEGVNAVISCELPQDGPVRDLVLQHMIHSCNHSCHPDDPGQECQKGCPWAFSDDTYFDERGYPHHRRRDCGNTCPNCKNNCAAYGKRRVCCNRLIVEFNPAILLLWDGHANVKFAGSVNLFAYLYKYLFKGPDFVKYDVEEGSSTKDEITEWQRGRYLCATECAWRIFGYTTYERLPHVICLPVHCEGDDWINYETGQEELALRTSISWLQRYFYRPAREPFLSLRYHEYFERFMVVKSCPRHLQPFFPALFPAAQGQASSSFMGNIPTLDEAPVNQRHFVYDKQRGENPICRLEMKYPKQKEVFYLRHMLLNHPKSSFADCKQHANKTYGSHEEAMLATGYFADVSEATCVLRELVALHYTAAQLRFAFLALLDQDAHPVTLYKEFEPHLFQDFLDRGASVAAARRSLQALLQTSCQALGKTIALCATPNAKTGSVSAGTFEPPADPAMTPKEATQKAQRLFKRLATDATQTAAASDICAAIRNCTEASFFVHGAAGSGKSTLAEYFTYTALAAKKGVVNVATTGQAASHLPFGATAHSVFQIPISDDDVLTCTLPLDSQAARTLAAASVIQWDEWPNARRSAWDSVLKLLQHLKEHYPGLWVNKVIICYGDFRQIPPVLKFGTRDAIFQNSVRASTSWSAFCCYELKVLHRQQRDSGYATWISSIGDGTLPTTQTLDGEPGYISLDLCENVFSEFNTVAFCFPAMNDPHDCADKKILAPTNAAVDSFNNFVLDKLTSVYLLPQYFKHSADYLEYDHGSDNVESYMTSEFLNQQDHNGVPPHKLRLVLGALYQVMRNFSPRDRLMNHTHVILRSVHDNHVVIETLDGRQFPLPRICFRWPLAKGTTTVVRRQYPLRPAYASTFNGAQGSTLMRCVVDSRSSPFMHGHLYVALGRVRERASVRIFTTLARCNSKGHALTKNIVWQELLLHAPAKPNTRKPVLKRPCGA